MSIKNNEITARNIDFGKWYTNVVQKANLADYSSVKGCMILQPLGFSIWENIQSILDKKFKDLGHQNVAMPLFIPESSLNKESNHIEGFAPEVAWITHGGSKELEERLCIRPTSEVLFGEYYSKKIKSYKDLPMLLNQWCNVVRWEKETRPFLRTREFFWQEGHTVHSTSSEAEKETMDILNVYKDFFQNILAIPVIVGKKTEKEKFAGAEYTLTVEALMYNGVALQSATSHYFGQKFSKAFDIKFANSNNELEYAYQTSWGTTTRTIGGIIMVHGDDNGLILPPKIAPIKVDIINIKNDDNVINISNSIKEKLISNNISCFIDNSDKSAGFKFADSEVKGTPIRIEVGPRDLKEKKITIVRRDNNEKKQIDLNEDLIKIINDLLNEIHNNMYNKALKNLKDKTFEATSLDEMVDIIKTKPGFIKASWCGDISCEEKIKEISGIKTRCIPFDEKLKYENCVCCKKPAKELVYFGIQY
ncbi:MAG: proline--tRNA ligase [Bacilli bacterium]